MKLIAPNFAKNLKTGLEFIGASYLMVALLLLAVILYIPTLGWSWKYLDGWMK